MIQNPRLCLPKHLNNRRIHFHFLPMTTLYVGFVTFKKKTNSTMESRHNVSHTRNLIKNSNTQVLSQNEGEQRIIKNFYAIVPQTTITALFVAKVTIRYRYL